MKLDSNDLTRADIDARMQVNSGETLESLGLDEREIAASTRRLAAQDERNGVARDDAARRAALKAMERMSPAERVAHIETLGAILEQLRQRGYKIP